MAAGPNVLAPDLEADDAPAGFRVLCAQVAAQAGAERLGATLYELPPGEAICPYHWHAANEEMLIVLRGRPTLRTPEGTRELAEGEVVAFSIGEHGAHQVSNRGSEPVRVLIASEMREPEVAVYPDSGKAMVRQQAPGREATGLRALFRLSDRVDYWDGEAPPRES